MSPLSTVVAIACQYGGKMNRLQEWKRRINATDFPDKQKACDGLDRIWATGEGGLNAEGDRFAGLFIWGDTNEGQSFWFAVNSKLKSVTAAHPTTNRRRKTLQETPRSGGEG